MNKLFIAGIFSLIFISACSNEDKSASDTRKWTLIGTSENGKAQFYIDYDSINLKSPGIYSYDELYNSEVAFEAISNDGRNIKSMISHDLVNCNNGTLKNGTFTAYSEGMGRGKLKFDGKSALQDWMGGVQGSIKHKIYNNICFPKSRDDGYIQKNDSNTSQSESEYMHHFQKTLNAINGSKIEDIKLNLKTPELLNDCTEESLDIGVISPREFGEVTGKGRAYFHVAPFDKCVSSNAFIIPGDKVIGYNFYEDFIFVMFTKDSKIVSGWIRNDRIKSTGSMPSIN